MFVPWESISGLRWRDIPVAISNAPRTRRFAGAQRGARRRLVTASFSRRSVAAAAVTANASTLIPTSAARHLLQDLDTRDDSGGCVWSKGVGEDGEGMGRVQG